jgi:hypothetical protein
VSYGLPRTTCFQFRRNIHNPFSSVCRCKGWLSMNNTSSPSSARATTTIRTMKTSPGQRRKPNRWAIFREYFTFRAKQSSESYVLSLLTYFENKWRRLMRSRCCLCVYICVCVSPIVSRQQLGKNTPVVARQRLSKNLL